MSTSPAPSNRGPIYRFYASRQSGPAGFMAVLLIKAGDVETNPGPTTTRKQVWICDICHRQIRGKKQISIRCNMIEHWEHLRCACIRLAQYIDNWTSHLHKESRPTTHTRRNTTQLSQTLAPLPTPTPPTPPTRPQSKHRHTSLGFPGGTVSKFDTPLFHTGLVKAKPNHLTPSNSQPAPT